MTNSGRLVRAGSLFRLGFGSFVIVCLAVGAHAADRSPQGCVKCHADIVSQWQCSAHARAWTAPAVRVVLDSKKGAECLDCHAPTPLLEQDASEPAKLREDCRPLGVDCNACHAVGCAYAGPYDSWGPHEMHQETHRLRSSAFCGTCHEVEFDEYESLYVPSVEGRSKFECAACHMPTYRDRLTQKSVLSVLHPKRIVRDHSFPVLTDGTLNAAIKLDGLVVNRSGKQRFAVQFALTNEGAGHCIPTGRFGDRQVIVRLELLDDAGQVLGQDELAFEGKDDDSLKPGKTAPFTRTVKHAGNAEPSRLRLSIQRVAGEPSTEVTMLSHEQKIDSSLPAP